MNFIGAMDKNAISYGENGHAQHTWSKSDSTQYTYSTIHKKGLTVETKIQVEKSFSYFEDTITQISFQLVRTKTPVSVISKYRETLIQLKANLVDCDQESSAKYREYIGILIKMCAQTRDIIDGKGEYALAYRMILILSEVFPKVGAQIFSRFVVLELDGKPVHPYGSWKDIKYISQLYKDTRGANMSHLTFSTKLINTQLKKDDEAFRDGAPVSLLAKWVPREGSSFGWMFEALAVDYYKDIMKTATEEKKQKAINLCKMNYRKLVSKLNKHLDTTQIKQCAEKWSNIVPEKVTSVTMFRNKKAFLNVTKKGDQRSSQTDRVECAEHFESFFQKAKEGKTTVKGKRVGLADFAKEALTLIQYRKNLNKVDSEIDLINLQWKDNSTQNGALESLVPLVDVSGSMNGDPLHAAISLGIRVAEKSKLGKRVLTFTSTPEWVNLSGIDNYVDMVEKLKGSQWGMNTNFSAALSMILDVIVQNKLSVEEVKGIALVIFSDMMIDAADKNYFSMYDMIEKKYADAGIQVHGEPYSTPHIIFWNLRSTNGFPSLTKQKNTSMLSGFSPMLLNAFCEKGAEFLENLTPWEQLKDSLDRPRYNILDSIIQDNI